MRKIVQVVLLAAAVSVNGAQKNVKLLTGLTDLQVQRVMNMMRGSLGVHCDFCHVVTEEKGWDFANDAKPEKNRARDMIRMTTDINRGAFGGNATVSCNTCHRGAIQPMTLVALPQTPPKFPTTRAVIPPLPSIESILAKYAATPSSTRVMKGQRTNWEGKSVPWELVAKGGKRYVRVVTPDGPVEQVDDGSTAWVRDAKGVLAMNANQREAFRANLAGLEFPVAIPADAAVVNEEKINDRDAWVVKASQHVFFFDASDGALLRNVVLTPTAIGTLPLQVDYDDYRAAGKTKFPFHIRVAMVDPWTTFTVQLESIELDAPVDDAIFEIPKEAAK